jgi:hypothetical protein
MLSKSIKSNISSKVYKDLAVKKIHRSNGNMILQPKLKDWQDYFKRRKLNTLVSYKPGSGEYNKCSNIKRV